MRYLRLTVRSGFQQEDGLILPLALFALLILAALSSALLAIGRTEAQITGNHVLALQAQYMAEAGLEDAFEAFLSHPSTVASAPTALTTVPNLNGASPTLATFGSYTMQYQAVGKNTVRVVATGLGADGTARKVLTAVFSNNYSADAAIITGGSLTISGSPAVSGTCGSIHSDADLSISGSPNLTGNLTATGTYTATGSPSAGGITGGARPTQAIPNINPADFLASAKATLSATQVFQMKSNGQILDGSDGLIATVTPGGSYRNWTYTSGTPARWSLTGPTGSDGTYYFEGEVSVSGSPGSPLTPWITTLIATGSITVSGSAVVQPQLTGTVFVAGADISISGNATLGTATLPGIIAAHEQISISGSATIYGAVVAQATSSTSSLVTADTFTGHATIVSNCGFASPTLIGLLQILSWGL